MSAAPVTLDFSKAQPINQGGVTLDFSKAQKIDTTSAAPKERPLDVTPGAGFMGQVAHHLTGPKSEDTTDTLGREVSSLGESIAGIPSGIYHSFADEPSTPEEKALVAGHNPVLGQAALGGERMIAAPIRTAAHWYKGAIAGRVPDPVGQALNVAPEAIGVGAAAPITEKLGEMAPKAAKTAAEKAVPAVTKVVEKARNMTPKQAAQVAGGASGAVAGHGTLSAPGAYYGAKTLGNVTQAVLGKERANAPIFRPRPVYPGAPLPEAPPTEVIQAAPIGTGGRAIAPPPSAALGKISAKPVYPGAPLPEHPGVFPGGNLPSKPPAELSQARAIGQGGARPPVEPSAGLGKIPAAPQAPVIARPNTSPRAIEGAINDSLGGRPLQPGVKLRDQMKAPAPPAAPSADLKPVQSSALKAYKYDPAKREFTGVTQNGAVHIHGDVSPEQVAKFEANPSKGKAWNELRQNSTPVAKVVNGKRVSTIPPRALQSASPDDLTDVLRESLRRVNNPAP
jgi:hypothetical protein